MKSCLCELRNLSIGFRILFDERGTRHDKMCGVWARRDHTVADGLEYVAALNSAQLPSADLQDVFRAVAAREQPRFSKM